MFGWDEVVEETRLAVVGVVKAVEATAKNKATIAEVEQIEGRHCGVRAGGGFALDGMMVVDVYVCVDDT